MTTHDKDKIIAAAKEAFEVEFISEADGRKLERFYAIAFDDGHASRDAEIAELKTNITFDWDRFKASQEALRENMKLMSEVMSDRRVLIEACETFMNHGVCEVSYYAIKEALAQVRKP